MAFKEDSEQILRQRKNTFYEFDSLQWLSENFIKKHGLRRNWNWKRIIKGIIFEHFLVIKEKDKSGDLETENIELIWYSFLSASGIKDLTETPVTSDPEHPHVKAILFLYSLDSFLFYRINQISRDKDTSAIESLGPYATVLSQVINRIQAKRYDKIVGKFICYSGLALSPKTIESWKSQKQIQFDGYRSSTKNLHTAKAFAQMSESDEKDQVILKFYMENETGKYYVSLDRPEYTCYLEEDEILLQAGLVGRLISYEVIREDQNDLTVFNVHISEKTIWWHRFRVSMIYIIPFAFYALEAVIDAFVDDNR